MRSKIATRSDSFGWGIQMNKLLDEIRQYCPEANMYLEDSGN